MNNVTVKELIDLLHSRLSVIPESNTEIHIIKCYRGNGYDIELIRTTEDEYGQEMIYHTDKLGTFI